MEFRLLGDLSIVGAAGPLSLGTPKQRSLAALLMVNANSLVALEQIVAELWGEAPPRSAVANVRTYAARIRAAFPPAERDRLTARRVGYRLRVEPDELDLSVFEAGAVVGRQALDRADPVAALAELSTALAQWRGPFAADVLAGDLLSAHEVGLNERRQAAEEDRCEALLALGQHASAAGSLRKLTSTHPLRERVWALLMRALYAGHDAPAALAAFAQVRRILAAELGIVPGDELVELHRAILRRDRALMLGRSARVGVRSAPAVPRQLPASTTLIGRADELAQLVGMLTRAGDEPVLACVLGPAGVGKTSLAVSAARLAAGHYPDGQLVAHLGDATGRSYTDLLRHLLDELGEVVRPRPGPDRLAARVRSALAGRRVLVLLDNVGTAAQVDSLVPAAGGSAVVVTSRASLAMLDGAEHVVLRALSMAESVDLLTACVGRTRVWAEPRAAARIAELCGGLPAAVRTAAARLIEQPDRSLQDLADRLARRLICV